MDATRAYSTGQTKNKKKFTLANFLSFQFWKSEFCIFWLILTPRNNMQASKANMIEFPPIKE